MPTDKIHKCDLLAEAEQHILLSNFIYLYSELRVLSGAGYAPFSPEDIDCKGGTSKGVLSDTIFLNLLKTLRKEDEDDPEGLIVALSKYPFVIADLRKLDEQIKQSLVDCGNPPKADYASHHHIGTPYNCLCAKHGLHYAQVLLDQTVTGAGAFDSDDHTKEEEDVQIDILSESTLLEALKQQLKPDSFLRSALSNPEKIVHINDSYPTKECVYAISSDESTQTIKVTFRGTVSKENWRANLRFERAWYPNPIQEEYPGRSDGVEFHKGFSDYLLRRRKDNGQSKLDEILDAVHTEGQAVFGGEKYRLVSTGHSLGGALATIFGYYASTNETLEIKRPVDILSFCSPRPGGVNFASAFQRQEKNKAVRHFRFYHKHDFVVRKLFINIVMWHLKKRRSDHASYLSP